MIDVTAATIAELALKSTVLPIAALLLVRGLRRRSAAERHIVWSAVVVALLAMPFAQRVVSMNVLPRLELGVRASALLAPQPAAPAAVYNRAGIEQSAAERSDGPAGTAPSSEPEGPSAATARLDRDAPRGGEAAGAAAAPLPLGRVLMIGYAGIASLLLARLVAGLVAARTTIGRLDQVKDPTTLALLHDARSRLGLRRSVRLLESPSDRTPWAFGVLAPVVVVPRAFTRWSEDARRNALLHELAHVARFDHATAVLARICAALYWPQPLVWLASRRLALEAERACDDCVLVAGGSRADYAAHLLAVASAMRGARSPSAAYAAMARSTDVAARISAILDADVRRTAMTKPKAAYLALAAAAVLAPIAVVKSQAPVEAVESPRADFGDPILAALASRGPVNSDELGAAVRAYVAQGLDGQAAELIAAYLDPRDRATPGPDEAVAAEGTFACAYCVSQLERSFAARPDAEIEPLLAALDRLEREARETRDGDLLVALAVTFAELDVVASNGLSLSFLLDGVAVGNLSANYKLGAAELLARRGWYEQAKALVEPMQNDAASPALTETIESWLNYFNDQIQAQNELKARLVSAAGDTSEYVPVYKVPPYYPVAAAGERGSVLVQFTVTETGRTKDLEIIESSNPVFNEPALWAAKQFRYAPRIVGGSPVVVEGVRNKITFQPLQPH